MALCACGCGKETVGMYVSTNSRLGMFKGQPVKYLQGHAGAARRKGKKFPPTKTHCKNGHLRTPDSVGPDGYCKICRTESNKRFKKNHPELREKRNEASRKWRKRNPDKVKAGEQKSKLKKAYNITVEEWSEMITKQGSKCLICRQEFDRSHRSTTPYVDHAHDATQHVRGILCQLCNLGLGAFHDNVTTLANAIQYLTKFKETQNSCQNARNTSYAQNQPEPILGAWVKPSYQELYFSLPETTA